MKNKSCVATWIISRLMMAASVIALAGCAGSGDDAVSYGPVSTPTVDYVESLDVYSAPHKDSFLNQLAMNYRSYAVYNARTSGYADMGELFAQKAVAAFSGELPFPESLDNWPVEDEQEGFELYTAYNELMEQLKNDASDEQPELAAEAQAKFDCWLSASASGQTATARQCRDRFQKAMTALRDCKNGKVISKNTTTTTTTSTSVSDSQGTVAASQTNRSAGTYYPDTRTMTAMNGAGNAREGVIIVNNVNVPEHLINPVPVQPLVFNQNIYGGDKTVSNNGNNNTLTDCPSGGDCADAQPATVFVPVVGGTARAADVAMSQDSVETAVQGGQQEIPMIGDELVSREEFINMMMAMRSELAAINARLDQIQAAAGEKTMIKVQQIPLEPKQHVMEEVFEIRFDFNKATIKPEYQELIQKLASATQANKNIKVSVVGHTDTAGSKNYNYALGGRRAEAVQKMLIQYGIPASQIVAVSAGEEDLAVPTPDNTPNAENRRVRVVKEVHYTEDAPSGAVPVAIEVEDYSESACGMYGCDQ